MFFSSLLFGISASLDALLVGITYGIRGVRIRPWQNLAISLVTLLGTCLSVGLGHRLVSFLPSSSGNYMGSIILILLGVYYIVKWLIPILRNLHTVEETVGSQNHEITCATVSGPKHAGTDAPVTVPRSEQTGAYSARPKHKTAGNFAGKPSPSLRLTEVLTLSLMLSLNNLSAGLSASLAGLTLIPAGISTFVCSVLFLSAGNRLGQNPVLQLAGKAAEPLSGALLVSLGVVQFFF